MCWRSQMYPASDTASPSSSSSPPPAVINPGLGLALHSSSSGGGGGHERLTLRAPIVNAHLISTLANTHTQTPKFTV